MKSEYITAEEASGLAHEAIALNGNYLREETNDVFNEIRKAAEKGNFYITLDRHLDPIITKRLKDQKFVVVYDSHRNESITTISWKLK